MKVSDARKLVPLEALRAMSDEQLASTRDEQLGALTTKAEAFARLLVAGRTAREVAVELGLSTNSTMLSRMKARVEPALRVLREEARRGSKITAESAAEFLGSVAVKALQAKDYAAATRAKSEQAKLLGLYPETRIRLGLEAPSADLAAVTPEEWEALSRLRHEVRRQLPPAIDVEARLVGNGPEVTSASESLSPGPTQQPGVTERPLSQEAIPAFKASEEVSLEEVLYGT